MDEMDSKKQPVSPVFRLTSLSSPGFRELWGLEGTCKPNLSRLKIWRGHRLSRLSHPAGARRMWESPCCELL